MTRAPYLLAFPLAVLTFAACSSGTSSKPNAAVGTTPEPSAIEAAADACRLPKDSVQDDGTTLFLDGRGKSDSSYEDGGLEYREGTLKTDDLWCALEEIGTPDSIITKMEHTRALDGMREEDSSDYSYSWTYHPDDGLDVIITELAS